MATTLPEQARGKNYGIAEGRDLNYPAVDSCLTVTLVGATKPYIFAGVHLGVTMGENPDRDTGVGDVSGWCKEIEKEFAAAASRLKRNQLPDVVWFTGQIGVWKLSRQAIWQHLTERYKKRKELDTASAIRTERLQWMQKMEIDPAFGDDKHSLLYKNKVVDNNTLCNISFSASTGRVIIIDRATCDKEAFGVRGLAFGRSF